MTARHRALVVPLLLLTGLGPLLTGCGADQEELQQWMEAERRAVKPNVETLQVPKKFVPQAYESAAALEPFSRQKLGSQLKNEPGEMTEAQRRELNRRKEPLEAFPLDSMAMVGSVVKGGQQFALLKVDKLLYQVKVGDYLGENAGRITKITETEITLSESVNDAANEKVDRVSTLQLQERAR